ncbi:Maltose transport system permease protein MalG [compost metagenome]
MLAVIGVFVLEKYLRRNRQFHAMSRSKPLTPTRLKGIAACGAVILCSLVWILAFLAPVSQIIAWSIQAYHRVWRADFAELILNSVTGAMLATVIIVAVALLSARTARLLSSSAAYMLARIMTAGYAVPGAIIAIGVLAIFIALDERLMPIYALVGLEKGSLVLSLSLGMLITGYVIRFMATGYNALDAGYEKISRSYSEASRTLGASKIRTFVKVELPLLKGSLISAFIVTFVEIMKELPLTLLLRPFNYNTLATRAYQYASDERIYEAALPSLLLIAVSLIPVLLIIRLERGKRE